MGDERRCPDDGKQSARLAGGADGNQRLATQTCSPALWEREIAFVLVFPESFPAFPAAWKTDARHIYSPHKRVAQETRIVPPAIAISGY